MPKHERVTLDRTSLYDRNYIKFRDRKGQAIQVGDYVQISDGWVGYERLMVRNLYFNYLNGEPCAAITPIVRGENYNTVRMDYPCRLLESQMRFQL